MVPILLSVGINSGGLASFVTNFQKADNSQVYILNIENSKNDNELFYFENLKLNKKIMVTPQIGIAEPVTISGVFFDSNTPKFKTIINNKNALILVIAIPLEQFKLHISRFINLITTRLKAVADLPLVIFCQNKQHTEEIFKNFFFDTIDKFSKTDTEVADVILRFKDRIFFVESFTDILSNIPYDIVEQSYLYSEDGGNIFINLPQLDQLPKGAYKNTLLEVFKKNSKIQLISNCAEYRHLIRYYYDSLTLVLSVMALSVKYTYLRNYLKDSTDNRRIAQEVIKEVMLVTPYIAPDNLEELLKKYLMRIRNYGFNTTTYLPDLSQPSILNQFKNRFENYLQPLIDEYYQKTSKPQSLGFLPWVLDFVKNYKYRPFH